MYKFILAVAVFGLTACAAKKEETPVTDSTSVAVPTDTAVVTDSTVVAVPTEGPASK